MPTGERPHTVVDADGLERALGVALAHDSHRQLDLPSVVIGQVQYYLLNGASGGAREGHVLNHGVALAQPSRLLGNEGGECSGSLYVSQTRVIEDGLLYSEGAYEGVRFLRQDAFVVGKGVVGRPGVVCTSSFGYRCSENLRHPGHRYLLYE